MTADIFSPYGSGPSPIGARNVVEIVEDAEAHLDQAERLLLTPFFKRGCDNRVFAELSAATPHEEPPYVRPDLPLDGSASQRMARSQADRSRSSPG